MRGKTVGWVLIVLLVVAVGGYMAAQNQKTKPAPLGVEPSATTLHGQSRDAFFDIIAAYCRAHRDPRDMGSCVACASETCPDCGFGPERSALLRGCNPNGWDCAASGVFAPATGGSCAFGRNGCNCPVGASMNAPERATALANLMRPAKPALFTPRPAP